MQYNGYEIKQAQKTGGKAGKGHNKTSTIQVQESVPAGYTIKKHFRYEVRNIASKQNAIQRAKDFVDQMIKARFDDFVNPGIVKQ